jgi:hypothetical protein
VPAQFGGPTDFTITEVLNTCGFVAFAGDITTDASGNLTGSATVQEVFTASEGATYDCTLRNDCVPSSPGASEVSMSLEALLSDSGPPWLRSHGATPALWSACSPTPTT